MNSILIRGAVTFYYELLKKREDSQSDRASWAEQHKPHETKAAINPVLYKEGDAKIVRQKTIDLSQRIYFFNWYERCVFPIMLVGIIYIDEPYIIPVIIGTSQMIHTTKLNL